jgi:3-polyprenyl-4-hydroxybenzoate decarboxylase
MTTDICQVLSEHLNLVELINSLARRILLRMGIKNDAYSHWKEPKSEE